MSKNVTVTLRGRLQYAKVLGDPVLNYDKSGKEWKFDFVPNEQKAVAKELAGYGIGDRLRSKTNNKTGEDIYGGAKFMSFRQKEFKNSGEANAPIEVVDVLGKPWDQSKLLGNDTVADVKFAVVDYGPGKKAGVYPRKIRVLDHVPYETDGFEPISEDDEYFAKAAEAAKKAEEEYKQFQKDFQPSTVEDELNDDLPV